jgi:hypothetical protein
MAFAVLFIDSLAGNNKHTLWRLQESAVPDPTTQ